VQDAFGNYVVQYVLELGQVEASQVGQHFALAPCVGLLPSGPPAVWRMGTWLTQERRLDLATCGPGGHVTRLVRLPGQACSLASKGLGYGLGLLTLNPDPRSPGWLPCWVAHKRKRHTAG